MDQELFEDVCDVLADAGFLMLDGDRDLDVEPTREGVSVFWRTRYAAPTGPSASFEVTGDDSAGVDYGHGVKVAIGAALAVVLEQAGYSVRAQGSALLVTTSAAEEPPRA